jgi:hypothetical protein
VGRATGVGARVGGDRTKIEPGLRELNLGPVKLIDADGAPVAERAAAAPK